TNTVLQSFPQGDGQTNFFSFQDNPRVSHFVEGLQSSDPGISADGRYVAVGTGTNEALFSAVHRIDFERLVEDLRLVLNDDGGAGMPIPRTPYYVTNLAHVSEMISSNPAPLFPRAPSMSADGNRIAFWDATIVTNNSGIRREIGVWVRDMTASSPWLLSTNQQGAAGSDDLPPSPAPSRDGLQVARESLADHPI